MNPTIYPDRDLGPLPLAPKRDSAHTYRVVDDECAMAYSCDGKVEFLVSIHGYTPARCPVCGKAFMLQITSHLEEVIEE